MPRPRRQPEDDDIKSWPADQAAEKYEDFTMGDDEEQDDEETLAVQSSARETVEPKSPPLRTRGRPSRVRDTDTREDAGVKLDTPERTALEPRPAKRRGVKRTSHKAPAKRKKGRPTGR